MNRHAMRVLIVSRGFPLAPGGDAMQGIFEWDQAIALSQVGIEVTFFAIDLRSFRRKRRLGYSHGIEKEINWHVIALPVGAIGIRLLNVIGRMAARMLYKKVYRHKEPPQLIHAHFGDVGSYAAAIKSNNNIPLIITEHSSGINRSCPDTGLLSISKHAYLQADVVVAVGKSLADSIKRYTGVEAVVVPNVVAVALFDRCKKVRHEGFRIATVSNLVPVKNTMGLLVALKELKLDYPNICVDVVGDGPLRGELEQYVIDNGLQSVVTFHGRLSRENICDVYAVSDCMAMVSRSETFGVAYVEAMAAGLPVIATRCGGPEDFVDETCGILVEVDNTEQLCEAIKKMVVNRDRYNADAIRKYVHNRFSSEAVSHQLIELYKSNIADID